MNTNQKGAIAEAHTVYHATKRGYAVSIPNLDCLYDLIIERKGIPNRVQVKYVTPKKGILKFSISGGWGGYYPEYSDRTIDALVLYDAESEKSYWVWIKDFPGTGITLRMEEPRNNQSMNIRMAKDYEW